MPTTITVHIVPKNPTHPILSTSNTLGNNTIPASPLLKGAAITPRQSRRQKSTCIMFCGSAIISTIMDGNTHNLNNTTSPNSRDDAVFSPPPKPPKPKLKNLIIPALASLIIIAAAVVFIPQLIRSSKSDVPTDDRPASVIASDVYKAAVDLLLQGDSDVAYADALAMFDTAIAQHDDEFTKNEIRFKKAALLSTRGDKAAAIAVLQDVLDNYPQLDYAQQFKTVDTLIIYYDSTGEAAKADQLRAEYGELYKGMD